MWKQRWWAIPSIGLIVFLFLLWRPWLPTQVVHAGERPNIILIVSETLRADRLQLYGHDRLTMPILRHLADDGVLFERASSVASWTLPSVASILTGLPPSAHGIRAYEDRLPDEALTLAEALKKRGYRTAFLGVNSLFEAGRNLEQGFDYYLGIDEISGEELNERILAWLHGRPTDAPVFMYIQYFEPHCRYQPPPAYRELFWPPSEAQRTHRTMRLEQWQQMHECFQLSHGRDEPILDVDYYLSEYDAELRVLDQSMGMLMERLKTFGLYQQGVVVFTSDHGEEFYEHDGFGHGKVLYEHNQHVPLIIRMPGGVGGGKRIKERVSSLDLFPTLLAAAGLQADQDGFGVDLGPAIRGETSLPADRAIFAETDYEGKQRAVYQGPWKWLVSPNGTRPAALFNLDSDPQEKTNLHDTQLARVEAMGKLLSGYETKAMKVGKKIPGTRQELTRETMEQLKSLGYTF